MRKSAPGYNIKSEQLITAFICRKPPSSAKEEHLWKKIPL
ncbi:hypothetical protein HMPREF1548_02210 [Clostridium sp. KLE 1755]|nr:hypothetical protein HMPREF1548_02210 [Clostridium sp. KLE 1755]